MPRRLTENIEDTAILYNGVAENIVWDANPVVVSIETMPYIRARNRDDLVRNITYFPNPWYGPRTIDITLPIISFSCTCGIHHVYQTREDIPVDQDICECGRICIEYTDQFPENN